MSHGLNLQTAERSANGPRSPLAADGERRRPAAPAPFRAALTLTTVMVLALVALEAALLIARPADPNYVLVLLLFPATASVYLGAGIVAWSRRPANRIGALMIVGALAWLGAGLLNVAVPALAGAGFVLSSLPLAIVMHLLLGFPSGRLRSRADRVVVAAIYVATILLEAPAYLFGQGPEGPCPALLIADRPDLAELGTTIQDGVGAVLAVATIALLAGRMRAAPRRQRRVLGPLYAYGIFVWLAVPLSARVVPELLDPVAMAVVQIAVLAGVPVAFALAVRRGAFARTGNLDEVSAWLALRRGGFEGLTEALAAALGDHSARLAAWNAETETYVDREGRSVPLAGPGRGSVPVELADRRVGAVVYDATLIADPALVRAAAHGVAVALDHERLTAELRRSRERIARASDDERQRIARDLHDGLQGRLVLLGVEAGLLTSQAGLPDGARAAAAEIRTGLEDAASELGALVQGLMPAALVERDLRSALEDLADRMPIRTEVEVEVELGAPAPSREAELTAYYVVAEALANALKHADARALRVGLRRRDGLLRVDVRDDGAGGATELGGTGVRGMADRLDVLGGSLTVTSPPGGGTHLVAEIPCGS